MDIAEACRIVHQWFAFLEPGGSLRDRPGDLAGAVAQIKRYLEREKADGKPIRELEIPDHLLATMEGVRRVLPFVLSAESMENAKRRKAQG